MTGAAHLVPGGPAFPRRAVLVAAAGAVLLVAMWWLAPAGALARGWLVAFAIWSGWPVGSLVLLMIHRLTGGRWGEALAPVLRRGACLVPLAALAFIPVALALALIYPWAADAHAAEPSVLRWYLNTPAFLLRAAIALVGWSVLGVVFGRGGGGRLMAGLGLAFYGLTISLVSIDWFLSVEPRYTSTAFGATIAIQQILTALAVAAMVAPATLAGRAIADLGAFMMAALLGVFYLALMTFIVDWYGDLPEKAAWYLRRGHDGWAGVIVLTVLIALAAFALLMKQGIRNSRTGLRIAGAVILAAIALHMAWIIAPGFPEQAGPVVVAVVGTLGLALTSALLGPRVLAGRRSHVG